RKAVIKLREAWLIQVSWNRDVLQHSDYGGLELESPDAEPPSVVVAVSGLWGATMYPTSH
ncbi:hypothetical protein ILYODFUR_010829, partial [Ilyodon furcidens]